MEWKVGGNLGENIVAIGKGAAVPLGGVLEDFTFTVTTTTNAINGTIKVQGSVVDVPDSANDDHWYDLLSVTAKGHTQVTGKPTRWLRRNVTIYVAGEINIYFGAT